MNKFEFNKEDYQNDIISYWDDISYFLQMLVKNGYHCSLRGYGDGDEAVVISYDYTEDELADEYLYWLNCEEATYIDEGRQIEKETENESF